MLDIPVSQLHPHPDNPRKDLGDLTELSASIKANGIFQNLTVIPDNLDELDSYTVIIGHRRLEAAKMAGVYKVPCNIVWEMSPQEQIQTMLLENMQRADLSVYEQAASFQQLLDFGMTVEEISRKSGFSETTVRRRVKMAELDRDMLKKVAENRQLNLGDFDELAKIEDIKERNRVLAAIGTNNFRYMTRAAIRQQNIAKILPDIKAVLKKLHANKLNGSDRWGTKYNKVEQINLDDWSNKSGEEVERICTSKRIKELFYFLDDFNLELYRRRSKESRRRPQAELDKEKAIAEAWDYIKTQSKIYWQLRNDFINGLTCNSKNETAVLRGALIAAGLEAVCYNSPDRDAVCKCLEMSNTYSEDRNATYLAALDRLENNRIPLIIYNLFGDRESDHCLRSQSTRCWPEYRPEHKLLALYKWLISLGYEMAESEKALIYGTDPHFEEWARKKKEEKDAR